MSPHATICLVESVGVETWRPRINLRSSPTKLSHWDDLDIYCSNHPPTNIESERNLSLVTAHHCCTHDELHTKRQHGLPSDFVRNDKMKFDPPEMYNPVVFLLACAESPTSARLQYRNDNLLTIFMSPASEAPSSASDIGIIDGALTLPFFGKRPRTSYVISHPNADRTPQKIRSG